MLSLCENKELVTKDIHI